MPRAKPYALEPSALEPEAGMPRAKLDALELLALVPEAGMPRAMPMLTRTMLETREPLALEAHEPPAIVLEVTTTQVRPEMLGSPSSIILFEARTSRARSEALEPSVPEARAPPAMMLETRMPRGRLGDLEPLASGARGLVRQRVRGHDLEERGHLPRS